MLQSRYERLVVVISEGLNREMEELGSSRPDDPRDKEALAVFESFASQLEGEVLVQYVRGGEQALACATVVQMAEYGLPHGSDDIGDIKPVAEETTVSIPKVTGHFTLTHNSGRCSFVESVSIRLLLKSLSRRSDNPTMCRISLPRAPPFHPSIQRP